MKNEMRKDLFTTEARKHGGALPSLIGALASGKSWEWLQSRKKLTLLSHC